MCSSRAGAECRLERRSRGARAYFIQETLLIYSNLYFFVSLFSEPVAVLMSMWVSGGSSRNHLAASLDPIQIAGGRRAQEAFNTVQRQAGHDDGMPPHEDLEIS